MPDVTFEILHDHLQGTVRVRVADSGAEWLETTADMWAFEELRDWMKEAAVNRASGVRRWRKGSLLIIDEGGAIPELVFLDSIPDSAVRPA